MGTPEEQQMAISLFLRRAKEANTAESQVAFFSHMYAIETGLQLEDYSPQIDGILSALLARVEKGKFSISLGADNKLHCESFALRLFDQANKLYGAGRTGKGTAAMYHAASIFIKTLRQFGELSPEFQEVARFAAEKAATLRKGLLEASEASAEQGLLHEPDPPSVPGGLSGCQMGPGDAHAPPTSAFGSPLRSSAGALAIPDAKAMPQAGSDAGSTARKGPRYKPGSKVLYSSSGGPGVRGIVSEVATKGHALEYTVELQPSRVLASELQLAPDFELGQYVEFHTADGQVVDAIVVQADATLWQPTYTIKWKGAEPQEVPVQALWEPVLASIFNPSHAPLEGIRQGLLEGRRPLAGATERPVLNVLGQSSALGGSSGIRGAPPPANSTPAQSTGPSLATVTEAQRMVDVKERLPVLADLESQYFKEYATAVKDHAAGVDACNAAEAAALGAPMDLHLQRELRLAQKKAKKQKQWAARLKQLWLKARDDRTWLTSKLTMLTLHEAMGHPLTPVRERLTARASESCGHGANARTFPYLVSWPGFRIMVRAFYAMLDDRARLFDVPFSRRFGEFLSAPGDESEWRGFIVAVYRDINDAALRCGLQTALEGGGSGLSESFTDLLFQHIGVAMNPVNWSELINGPMEVKPEWAIPLQPGELLEEALHDPERIGKVVRPIQQVFGDAVMDEAPMFLLGNYQWFAFGARSADPADKHLLISDPFWWDCEDPPVRAVLFFGLYLADRLRQMKTALAREKVPATARHFLRPIPQRRDAQQRAAAEQPAAAAAEEHAASAAAEQPPAAAAAAAAGEQAAEAGSTAPSPRAPTPRRSSSRQPPSYHSLRVVASDAKGYEELNPPPRECSERLPKWEPGRPDHTSGPPFFTEDVVPKWTAA